MVFKNANPLMQVKIGYEKVETYESRCHEKFE
jgi:hypothetical protein